MCACACVNRGRARESEGGRGLWLACSRAPPPPPHATSHLQRLASIFSFRLFLADLANTLAAHAGKTTTPPGDERRLPGEQQSCYRAVETVFLWSEWGQRGVPLSAHDALPLAAGERELGRITRSIGYRRRLWSAQSRPLSAHTHAHTHTHVHAHTQSCAHT